MKKLVLLLSMLLITNGAFAYNYSDTIKNSINVNGRVNYIPETKTWTKNYSPKSIDFIKHITVGSGGFSEYAHIKTFYDTNTTYEFLNDENLIGYNMHLLKFFELGFDTKITHRELNEEEIQRLFPEVEIVKISQFKNNKIILKKPKNVKRTYLLVNDTERDFYKYYFENNGNGTEIIKGLFETEKPITLIYSHFSSRNKMYPALKIVVKNSLFAK